tara:strand:- start:579 stop:737 length:159 start_codon:yes stop_codon:yes gene_type:complete
MSKTKRKIIVKKRNPEKVVMDKFYRPSIFRSHKREFLAKEAQKEIDNYKEGY